MFWGGIVKEG